MGGAGGSGGGWRYVLGGGAEEGGERGVRGQSTEA